MIDLGHSVRTWRLFVVSRAWMRGNVRGWESGQRSSCKRLQVCCAQILVPVSYIPLQETMKILDLMQDREDTGRDGSLFKTWAAEWTYFIEFYLQRGLIPRASWRRLSKDHGLAYNNLQSESLGLSGFFTTFVPNSCSLLLWAVTRGLVHLVFSDSCPSFWQMRKLRAKILSNLFSPNTWTHTAQRVSFRMHGWFASKKKLYICKWEKQCRYVTMLHLWTASVRGDWHTAGAEGNHTGD